MVYTPGKASSMYSDWLGTLMKRVELEKEEREYKAPLGERNIGIVNATLAGANTIKKINDTIRENRLAMKDVEGKNIYEVKPSSTTPVKEFPTLGTKFHAGLRKAKETIFGPKIGKVQPKLPSWVTKKPTDEKLLALGGPMKKYNYGGKVKKYQDGDFLKKVPTLPDIETEMPLDIKALGLANKGSELIGKAQGIGGEAQSMVGSTQTLASEEAEPLEKMMAAESLATSEAGEKAAKLGVKGVKAGIKGAKSLASKLAKKKLGETATEKGVEFLAKEGTKKLVKKKLTEVGTKKGTELLAKEAAKKLGKVAAKEGSKWAGKLAPGVGVGLGTHQIATSDSALGKLGGAFDVAAGLTSWIPGVGTAASGILGGIGTGLSALGGVSGGPSKKRRYLS